MPTQILNIVPAVNNQYDFYLNVIYFSYQTPTIQTKIVVVYMIYNIKKSVLTSSKSNIPLSSRLVCLNDHLVKCKKDSGAN